MKKASLFFVCALILMSSKVQASELKPDIRFEDRGKVYEIEAPFPMSISPESEGSVSSLELSFPITEEAVPVGHQKGVISQTVSQGVFQKVLFPEMVALKKISVQTDKEKGRGFIYVPKVQQPMFYVPAADLQTYENNYEKAIPLIKQKYGKDFDSIFVFPTQGKTIDNAIEELLARKQHEAFKDADFLKKFEDSDLYVLVKEEAADKKDIGTEDFTKVAASGDEQHFFVAVFTSYLKFNENLSSRAPHVKIKGRALIEKMPPGLDLKINIWSKENAILSFDQIQAIKNNLKK